MENTKKFDIYVINLEKDTERLEKINKCLDNKFVRIPGIYGERQDFTKNNDIFYSSRYFCPKSALGCFMSHQLAIKTFLETSKKDYALMLEDDAEPCFDNYMEKINESIQNAPIDWDIIKLDYFPNFNLFGEKIYTKFPSLMTTAYIINKKSAEKILKQKIVYHIDVQFMFMGLKFYNNPEIIFQQIWDEKNNSNNRVKSFYNLFGYESWNFKAIRFFDKEYTFADLLLFLLSILFLIFLIIFFTNKEKYGNFHKINSETIIFH